MKQLPNLLTASRIFLIPVLVAAFYVDDPLGSVLTATIFGFASITDFLDGYAARRFGAHSKLGMFLDPVADKLLVAAAILMLVDAGRADIIPSLLILCREILVSGLREFLAELKVSVPVSRLAKWKTGVQMTALIMLLAAPALPSIVPWLPFVWHAGFLGNLLLWVAALLTVVTGYAYLRTGLKHM